MNFIDFSKKKGFFYQSSNEEGLNKLLSENIVTFYIGFDCTAESLHIGSLFQIMNIRNLQKFGHKPIILIGSGTSRIGDPSYRNEARPVLSAAQIEQNKKGIKKSLEKFIKFGDGPKDAIMVDNNDWLSQINYLDFLQEFGSLISINKMLTYDIIKTKIENQQNLTFLEFNYMLMQAYDFLYLNEKYGCRLQLGGSDQWVNIINGVELGRKKNREELFALTAPLITSSSGQKMGKTAKGAIWLNEELLSPYDYYQYWRNIEDQDVIKFINIFTDLSDEEIYDLSKLQGRDINEAKKILAYQATLLCHGRENAEKAQMTAENIFEKGKIEGEILSYELSKTQLNNNFTLVDALCFSNMAKSKSEARRSIQGGALKINDEKISDENYIIKLSDFFENNMNMKIGKKNFVIFKLVD